MSFSPEKLSSLDEAAERVRLSYGFGIVKT